MPDWWQSALLVIWDIYLNVYSIMAVKKSPAKILLASDSSIENLT